MTMALAIIIPLSMLIYSNSRITEMRETLRAEMGQMEGRINTRFIEIETRMEKRFDAVDRKLDEILRILGDHETRITKLEHPPH